MPVATIAAFWGVSMLFVLTPGADWAYAISSGLRHRSVVPAVGGLLSGHLLATLVVAAGVAALLAGSPAMLAVMTVGSTPVSGSAPAACSAPARPRHSG
jgi:threonine/homoserine/homoserine lactone efflux protein